MIRELLIKLRTRAKEVVKAVKAKLMAFNHFLKPSSQVRVLVKAVMVKSGPGNAFHIRNMYRETSDHSPIFSLYTFFGDR